MKYQLTCECGKRVDVTVGDAGTAVNCVCGKSIAVPGLGELKRLDPQREPEDESAETDDDAAGRRGLLGLILVAAGLVTSCIISATMSRLEFSNSERSGWSTAGLVFTGIGTALLASARGHPFLLGLLLGTLCGPFGALIILLMPSRKR